MARGGLPPAGSWSGNWGSNKKPYGQHYRGRDRKPSRQGGGGGGNSGCRPKPRTFMFAGILATGVAALVELASRVTG